MSDDNLAVETVRGPVALDDLGPALMHEHVFVLEGSCELGPVETCARVAAGDLASYPSDRPHTWRTGAGERARVLVLQIMPRPRSSR